MIVLPLIFGFLILIIVSFGTCKISPEAFATDSPILELHVHRECEKRCKSFIDNVWGPALAWMGGPDGRGFATAVVDATDAQASNKESSKMDLATRDLSRDAYAQRASTYPIARVVRDGVPHVYTGSHDWPAFRRWLATV